MTQANRTSFFFFFQAEDGIRDFHVTGVQTCALPISGAPHQPGGEQAEEPDVRTDVPEGHPRSQEIGERLLDVPLVDAGPVVLLGSGKDRQPQSRSEPGANPDGNLSIGHGRVDHGTEETGGRCAAAQPLSEETWSLVQNTDETPVQRGHAETVPRSNHGAAAASTRASNPARAWSALRAVRAYLLPAAPRRSCRAWSWASSRTACSSRSGRSGGTSTPVPVSRISLAVSLPGETAATTGRP